MPTALQQQTGQARPPSAQAAPGGAELQDLTPPAGSQEEAAFALACPPLDWRLHRSAIFASAEAISGLSRQTAKQQANGTASFVRCPLKVSYHGGRRAMSVASARVSIGGHRSPNALCSARTELSFLPLVLLSGMAPFAELLGRNCWTACHSMPDPYHAPWYRRGPRRVPAEVPASCSNRPSCTTPFHRPR